MGGEDPGDVFEATFSIVDVIDIPSDDVPADLHWAMVTSSMLTVPQGGTIEDLNVTLDIWYPFDGDLSIYLTSPKGTRVALSTHNGGLDADFSGTVFDDEGDVPIGESFAPYAGSHQPDGQLSAFDGENAAGTWTLTVEVWPFSGADGLLYGDGYINAWSLQLEGGDGTPPPPPPVGNRAPVAKDDAFVGNDVNEDVILSTADLLANDTDPDGNALTVTFLGNEVGGGVFKEGTVIKFTPDPFFQGTAGFDYIISDGLLTDVGHVSIDIEPTFQWHNLRNPLDVDDRNGVGPLDAVLIINVLNAHGGGTPLESIIKGAAPEFFYDVVPNNVVSPIDAIQVINYLNAQAMAPSAAASSAAESSETASNKTTGRETAAAGMQANHSQSEAALHAHCVDLLLAELDASRANRRRR